MNNMLQLFIGAWMHPWRTMGMVKEQPQDTSIKPAIVYVVVVGLISGLITGLMGYAYPDPRLLAGGVTRSFALWSILLLPLFYAIGSFISATIVWGIVVGFVRGSMAEYKTIYRLLIVPVAFYPVSTLLAAVPPEWGLLLDNITQWIAVGINVWATAVLIGGVVIVMGTPKVRTIVTFVLIFLTFIALSFLMMFSMRSQIPGQPLTAGDFGAGDFDVSDEELDAQLDDMVGKGKNPAGAPSKATAPSKK